MNQEILDYRLQHYLRTVIDKLPINQQIQLKNISKCNQRLIHQNGVEPGVFLLTNNNGQARFFGQVTCKNPWACPTCSAKMMAKYSAEIAIALDLLRTENYFGFMMTFTIPHARFMSCRETTDILYRTWRVCFQKGRSGNIRNSNKRWQPFINFLRDLEIKHRVRCAEYTWGENGWHPHFHAIFWVKRNRINEVLQYESQLNEYWIKTCKEQTLKYWQENNLHGSADAHADLFKRYTTFNKEYQSVTISKRNQKIAESLSSDYIAGWGANKELTGNYRKEASHENHFTPYQILEKAADGNEKMQKLYIEFMLQVTKKPVHHRVDFSQSGLKAKIKLWKKTQQYKECIKKNKQERGRWVVACWFTKQQWLEIFELNRYSPILSNLLWLAANKKELLEEFLNAFNIKLTKRRHLHTDFVEKIFNAA